MKIKRTLLRTYTLQDFCGDNFLDVVVEETKSWNGYWFTASFSRQVTDCGSRDVQRGLGRAEEAAIASLANLISGKEVDIAGLVAPVRVPILAPYKP